ncbi:hypothetical protein [Actinoplanes derwentensis]|uniref:Glycosyl transferase family 2 n=1 Tax=Actinoplanes derwentensis TaxID=113562 RepID=A0A1H2CVV5_9ACTN|nr:hypothetical protein [Actinoplanes derwentensis]GID82042.1 hypothetical protein Ade03nite_09660 [Actinoplanes derwentensis]SDT74449.1 hypothetical protein SAMN04489716_6985 [Actinoplanes derwentensis]
MTPILNIIYTRGTVAALARFAPLFTGHTGWRYRLVANGCTPDEVALLHRIAAVSDRLSVHDLESGEVVPHGETLCRLADTFTGDEFFGIADSDIVCTGDFTATATALLDDNAAIFGGTPLWARPQDTVLAPDRQEVCGPHIRTPAGLLFGSSYFAVYRRTALDEVQRRCAVTLDKYTAANLGGIDGGFRGFLKDRDAWRSDYTPGKLLNTGFVYLDRQTAYNDFDDLIHIGGYSMATFQEQVSAGQKPAGPAAIRTMLGFNEYRGHMDRKLAVCERTMRSFASIDETGEPWRGGQRLPDELEDQIRVVEDLYARQAHLVAA